MNKKQELEEQLEALRRDLAAAQAVAARAAATWGRLRAERDLHRMHHKRVAQEKARLVADVRRLKVRDLRRRRRSAWRLALCVACALRGVVCGLVRGGVWA